MLNFIKSVASKIVSAGSEAYARKLERREGIVVNPSETKRFWQSERLRMNIGDLEDAYSQHSWTYGAITALARNIASVPFRILTGDADQPTVVQEGPWVELFDNVNPHMEARSQLWESIVIWLSMSGEAAVYKGGDINDDLSQGQVPTELWPMNGKLYEPELADNGMVRKWITTDGRSGKRVEVEPDRLARIKYYNPRDPLRGLAPLEPALRAASADFKAQQFNEAFFDNDGTPGGMIKHKEELTPEQKKEMKQAWEDQHRGLLKRRRLAFLDGGAEFQTLGDSLRDMEFVNLRNMSRDEICAVFKVPLSELAIHQNLNFATALSADRGFWTKSLIPIMRLIEDSFWVQLFSVKNPTKLRRMVNRRRSKYLERYGIRLDLPDDPTDEFEGDLDTDRPDGVDNDRPGEYWGEFDLTSIESLRSNLDLKLTSAQRLMQMGYTLNQINKRMHLGMPDVPWGDIPYATAGTVPLSQLFLPGEDGGLPPEIGGGQPTPTPVLPAPNSGEPGAQEEEPTAVGEDAGSAPAESRSSITLYKDTPITKFIRARAIDLHKRQSPKGVSAWNATMKNVNTRFEPLFRNRFRRYLVQLRAVQLARLRAVAKNGPLPDEKTPRIGWSQIDIRKSLRIDPSEVEKILFNEERAKNKVKSQHHPLYVRISEKSADQVALELGGSFAFDVTDPAMADVLADREEILAKVPVTIRKRLARSLEKGVAQGETIAELADRIRAEFNLIGGARSLMIARTEVASTQSVTRQEAFIAEGVKQHQWITARDEAVRASHARQDGVKRAIGQPFPNGLIHPAETGGSPGEVINCRCIAISVG